MSRDWTQEEFQSASKTMKAAGHLDNDEFCEHMTIFTSCLHTKTVLEHINLITLNGAMEMWKMSCYYPFSEQYM